VAVLDHLRANRTGLATSLASVAVLALTCLYTLTGESAAATVTHAVATTISHRGSHSKSNDTGSGNTASDNTASDNTASDNTASGNSDSGKTSSGNTGSGDTGNTGSGNTGSGGSNNPDPPVTPTVLLDESNGTTTCYSNGSAGGVTTSNANGTCAIDDLVGTSDQVPGGTSLTTTLTFTNVGIDATTVASMAASSCTVAAAVDDNGYIGSDTAGFCGEIDVTISNTTPGAADMCVYPTQAAACPALSSAHTLAGLAGGTFNAVPLSTLVAGGSATYVVDVELDASATNADQGLTATVPISWSIGQ
jgi:hypothetical protein